MCYKFRSYELRVVIWNTAEVPCIDTSITGEELVDIFLKGLYNFLRYVYEFPISSSTVRARVRV